MDKTITTHEGELRAILEKNIENTNWPELIKYNKRCIDYFQMERLVHLIVTLAFAFFTFLSVSFVLVTRNMAVLFICFLLLILLVPYILHYFNLENGVQRLYKLDKDLEQKLIQV